MFASLRTLGFALVAGLWSGSLVAQTLSPDQARDDLLYLRRQLRTYHPGLGHYTPNARMEAIFDSLYNRVNEPMAYLGFFHHLAPYINGLKDGHTNLNHRRGFIHADTRYVPFYVRQVGTDYFVSHNAAADTSSGNAAVKAKTMRGLNCWSSKPLK